MASQLAGMCRQETTVRFGGWKAVKDRTQATELRPVSAGRYHLQLPTKVRVGVGCGEGCTKRSQMQTATLFPSPSDCGHIPKP